MTERKVLWEMSAPAAGVAAAGQGLFEKELLRVGRWAHPAGKFVLDVTWERLARWVEGFRRMTAKGIAVPVPYGHSYDARDNAGFLREMRVEGDRLIGVLDVPREEDAARLGATATAVSVSVNPDFVDGAGERFGEVIEHVAVTNHPIVPGQENFVPLSGDGAAEVVRLEMEVITTGAQRHTEEQQPGSLSHAEPQRRGEEQRPHPVPTQRRDERNEEETPEREETREEREPLLTTDGTRMNADGVGPATAVRGQEEVKAEDANHAWAEAHPMSRDLPGGEAITLADEPPVPHSAGERELQSRITRLERERVEAEVEGLICAGRISPAVAPNVTRLLLAGGERFELSATGESVSPADELRAILAAIPAGAWVPLETRATGARGVARKTSEVSEERAKKLAMENVDLMRKGG